MTKYLHGHLGARGKPTLTLYPRINLLSKFMLFGYNTLVAYVLWWIGVVWVSATAVVVLTVCICTGNQMDRVMTPVRLATAVTEARFITIFAKDMSARLAVPMLVVGYFAIGIALFMTILLYGIYLHRQS